MARPASARNCSAACGAAGRLAEQPLAKRQRLIRADNESGQGWRAETQSAFSRASRACGDLAGR